MRLTRSLDDAGLTDLSWLVPILDKTGSRQPPKFIAVMWLVGGLAIWVTAVPVFELAPGLMGRLLAAPVVLFGWILVREGLKRWQPTVAEAMQRDRRAPVLYLRDFEWDGYSPEGIARDLARFAFVATPREDPIEEYVKLAADQVGPFIALGRFRDTVPNFGASRIYCADVDWQEIMTVLIQHAGAVVLSVADEKLSGAIEFEIQTARSLLTPSQIFVVLWRSQKQSGSLQSSQEDAFRLANLLHVPEGYFRMEGRRAPIVLRFDADGSPALVVPPDIQAKSNSSVAVTLANAFTESGLQLRPRSWWNDPVSRLRMLLLMGLLLAFAFYTYSVFSS